VYLLTFGNSTDTVDVIWNYRQKSTFQYSSQSGQRFRIINGKGKTTAYYFSKNQTFNLSISPSPVYVHKVNAFPFISVFNFEYDVDTLITGQKLELKARIETESGVPVFVGKWSDLNWTTLGGALAIDSAGYLFAKAAGAGVLKCQFEDATFEHPITVIPPFEYREIVNFNSLEQFTVRFENLSDSSKIEVVDSNFTSPPKALSIQYAFEYKGIRRQALRLNCDIPLLGEPDSLLIDIFNDGNAHQTEYLIQDADGKQTYLRSPSLFPVKGWQTSGVYFRRFGSLYKYPARLKQITLYFEPNDPEPNRYYSGTVLIDRLRIHQKALTGIKPLKNIRTVKGYFLYQNYPNPFNGQTRIEYQLPADANIELSVFDVLGKKVLTLDKGFRKAGRHQTFLNGRRLSSGIYIYLLKTERFSIGKKMLLLK